MTQYVKSDIKFDIKFGDLIIDPANKKSFFLVVSIPQISYYDEVPLLQRSLGPPLITFKVLLKNGLIKFKAFSVNRAFEVIERIV